MLFKKKNCAKFLQKMVFEFNARNLELLAVVIEGRGKRVEEAGNHVHSKAVLGRTCEPGWRSWLKFVAFFSFHASPSHVSPTSLADQKVGALELEPDQLGGF